MLLKYAGKGILACVDHGELVNKLHWILESTVEQERSSSNSTVSNESNQEDTVVVIFHGTPYAFDAQCNEEYVGQGVDDLCRIDSGIVVLLTPVD